ncbi:hypothetical protein OEZ86_001813 [Tetradesmus obliquus]|nr:hypothetical protein OEZ86_001813 [Tetradesmus obliquus]
MTNAAQQQAQAQRAAAAAAAGLEIQRKLAGKKRKAQEKAPTEKAYPLIPESALFNQLVMQERELDNQIKRQRLAIQAASAPYDHPVMKRLRIYIFATHANQPAAAAAAAAQDAAKQQQQQVLPRTSSSSAGQQPGSGSSSSLQEPPQWTLNLWGRLVDLNDPPAPADSAPAALTAAMQASAQPKELGPAPPGQQQPGSAAVLGKAQPFSSVFKHICVQLDQQQYPGSQGLFEWDKFMHRGAHKDRLEIKRQGSSNVTADITLTQDFMPQAYVLDPRLAELLGVSIGPQNSVLARVWSYIHNQKPQDARSPVLQLDEKLAGLMGCQQLVREALPAAVGKLLQPVQPIKVQHTIDVSGPSPGAVTCLDVDVLLPLKVQEKLLPTLDALLDDKQFEAMDQKLAAQLAKLFEARRRRAMLLGFAEAPVAMLNAAIAAAAREVRVPKMFAGPAEVERRTDVFNEKWVDEAAAKYLGKRNGAAGFVG